MFYSQRGELTIRSCELIGQIDHECFGAFLVLTGCREVVQGLEYPTEV